MLALGCSSVRGLQDEWQRMCPCALLAVLQSFWIMLVSAAHIFNNVLCLQEIEFAKTKALQLCSSMEGVTPILDRPSEAVPFNTLPLGSNRQRSKKHTAPTDDQNEDASMSCSSEQQAESSIGNSLEPELDARGLLPAHRSENSDSSSSNSSSSSLTANSTLGCNGNSHTAASLVEDLTKKVCMQITGAM